MKDQDTEHPVAYQNKKQLLEYRSQAYKEALKYDLQELDLKTRRFVSKAILIGGGAYISYRILKKIFGKSHK